MTRVKIHTPGENTLSHSHKDAQAAANNAARAGTKAKECGCVAGIQCALLVSGSIADMKHDIFMASGCAADILCTYTMIGDCSSVCILVK